MILVKPYRGLILVCPLYNKTASGIMLNFTEANKIEFTILETEKAGYDQWDWKTDEKNLERYLTLAGFKDLDVVEVRETVKVINGTMAGPKGTVLTGQTKVLKIWKWILDMKNGAKKFRKYRINGWHYAIKISSSYAIRLFPL
jgi:hypothetical protein